MTVEQLIHECNIFKWQRLIVKKGSETLGGGYSDKIIKRYGDMVIDTIWSVEGILFVKVR